MAKVPRYSEFRPASALASKIKRKTKSRNSRPEMLLRRELWRQGLRYRLHDKRVPGKPDLVFRSARVVVFVDGDFWHGRDWKRRRKRLAIGSNPRYWLAKIGGNITRDKRTTRKLERLGWVVIRIWETDIVSDVSRVATTIEAAVAEQPDERQ